MAIRGPKGAHPTVRGWINPKTGELLKAQKISGAQIAEWHGGEMGTAPPPKKPSPAAAVNPHIPQEPAEAVEVDEDKDINSMSKNELEAYGRTVGIELDRRLLKSTMIEQLQEHLDQQ